jgi:hypothetical protein
VIGQALNEYGWCLQSMNIFMLSIVVIYLLEGMVEICFVVLGFVGTGGCLKKGKYLVETE